MSYHEQTELVNECEQCHKENKMHYYFCCLFECGEHEFCRGCHNNGKGKKCRRKESK